jgi:hypothetical protein
MGFIKVIFSEVRNVIINDVDSNQQTGQTIELEEGLQTITMSGPADFAPAAQDIMVDDSSGPLSPQEVHFEKI